MGGENPIRLQSMTNTSTQDTDACVEQAKRIVDAGGEYVRLTTQGVKEAENLKPIKEKLKRDGYFVPLVADVHFNPKVADVAALYADKVRINPGNYASTPEKIREHFIPFLALCKEHNTAVRIGVNHGSLSERIMDTYGDTPEGMVESCMEFLRICVEQEFYNVVISIKASNTVVMVRTVRLLAHVMEREGIHFPLHLGVTEAGDGEDGRIKSALGIGALLTDGLGDTIRVSLSEEPEMEIPVARKLVDYVCSRANHPAIPEAIAPDFNYFAPSRRKTHAVHNIGGDQLPVVISCGTGAEAADGGLFTPDYIYCGTQLPTLAVEGCKYILESNTWKGEADTLPAFNATQLQQLSVCHASLKFLTLSCTELTTEVMECLRNHPEVVLLLQSSFVNRAAEHRASLHRLMLANITTPVVFLQEYTENEAEELQVKSATDMGPLIFDGFCDGLFLRNRGSLSREVVNATAFGILQAGRIRVSKTEYISCPGCGRTLFNLQETIARVKAATSHLVGLKIGIMGCIVNGPGEMADADYGYVGAGRGKVSLYKQKECVAKNIPEEEAVDKLIELIKANGDYIERECLKSK